MLNTFLKQVRSTYTANSSSFFLSSLHQAKRKFGADTSKSAFTDLLAAVGSSSSGKAVTRKILELVHRASKIHLPLQCRSPAEVHFRVGRRFSQHLLSKNQNSQNKQLQPHLQLTSSNDSRPSFIPTLPRSPWPCSSSSR